MIRLNDLCFVQAIGKKLVRMIFFLRETGCGHSASDYSNTNQSRVARLSMQILHHYDLTIILQGNPLTLYVEHFAFL